MNIDKEIVSLANQKQFETALELICDIGRNGIEAKKAIRIAKLKLGRTPLTDLEYKEWYENPISKPYRDYMQRSHWM